jgi:hypothetical protein
MQNDLEKFWKVGENLPQIIVLQTTAAKKQAQTAGLFLAVSCRSCRQKCEASQKWGVSGPRTLTFPFNDCTGTVSVQNGTP